MKKGILIAASIFIVIIIFSGIFSAGLIVGNILNNNRTTIPNSFAELPVINQTENQSSGVKEIGPTETNPSEFDIPPTEINVTEESIIETRPTTTPSIADVPPPVEGLSDLFKPFWETWEIIHKHYVDQPVNDSELMAGAIDGMISVMDVTSTTHGTEISDVNEYPEIGGTPDGLHELFTPFWTSWTLIHAVDNEQLLQGAISGMLDSLGDPHTSYINPEDYEEATMIREGEEHYEGIGAWVDVTKDYLTIVTPFPDSPADKAGLKPGDKILAINGEDMTGLDGELVRQKVIGPAGTTITITVGREGLEPFDVDVTRKSIVAPSVEAYMLDENIAYIRLYTFGDKSHEQIRNSLNQLLAQNPTGLVFDLRSNPGGTVESAVNITSEFIDEGVVFYEVYGDGTRDIHEVDGEGLATEIPLIVLVDQGSASASEIFSGAIQDNNRGLLVGTTTFGKGSVQYWIPLSNDQGAVRVTIASWITPNERLIHQTGLKPDIPIMGIPKALIDDGFDVSVLEIDEKDIVILSDQEILDGRDVQLEKAIEILLTQEQ